MTMFDDAQSSKGGGIVQIRDISEIVVDGTSG
jgi:hypothetical protein